MVEIKPLKGWLYNKEKIKDFSKVITPPNDVISLKEKEDLKTHHHSFVNLILPNGEGNKYENASKLLKEWQKEKIFIQDKEENIYIYQQSYSVENKNFSRIGFIALIKLEDLGKGVLPHEKILEKDLKDRIALHTA